MEVSGVAASTKACSKALFGAEYAAAYVCLPLTLYNNTGLDGEDRCAQISMGRLLAITIDS